jgi:hypothetical protein
LELHGKIESLNTEITNNQNLAMGLLQTMKDQVEQVGEEKVKYLNLYFYTEGGSD